MPSTFHNGPAVLDLVEVDPRHRVNLPARLTAGLSWLSRGEKTDRLLKMEEPRRIALLAWEHNGAVVEAKRGKLAETFEDDEEAQGALAILEYVYQKVTIERNARLALSSLAIAHLFQGAPGSQIVILRKPAQLELWSPSAWNGRVARSSPLLDDLP